MGAPGASRTKAPGTPYAQASHATSGRSLAREERMSAGGTHLPERCGLAGGARVEQDLQLEDAAVQTGVRGVGLRERRRGDGLGGGERGVGGGRRIARGAQRIGGAFHFLELALERSEVHDEASGIRASRASRGCADSREKGTRRSTRAPFRVFPRGHGSFTHTPKARAPA